MSSYNTDDVPFKQFEPHGRIRMSIVDECIVVYRAEGPFNLELLKALEEIEATVVEAVKAKAGKWSEIVIFENSCMATAEFIDALGPYIKGFQSSRLSPLASAYVIPDDLDGASLMKDLYRKVFEEAGLVFFICPNEQIALKQIKAYMADH